MAEVIKTFPATIVVAVARNGVIGRENTLPWRLSSDLQRFKRLTMGHALIMGRKTFESIGKGLPGRTTVVLSRSARTMESQAANLPLMEGILFCENFDEAIRRLPNGIHPFVVGGSQIYAATLPLVNRIWVTRVLADVPGDAFMPEWSTDNWKLVFEESVPAGLKDQWPSRFEEWTRT